MPKLDDRWSLGLWLGRSLASDEHSVGTSAGVRRCRSIWRSPENQRWRRKAFNEMIGDPWNPTPQPKEKPQVPCGVYITVDRGIKYGGTKVCPACFGHAKVHSPECRARFQDIVDNEAAQTAAASAADAEAETSGQAAGGSAPSSSSGPAPAAGGPALEDVNKDVTPESSAAQPASSAVRTLVAEDRSSAKRHKLLACIQPFTNLTWTLMWMRTRRSSWRRCPTIVNSGLSGSLTWTRCIVEPRAESCLTRRRCMRVGSGSLRTLRSWRWRNPFRCRRPELQSLEIVYWKWLDPEDTQLRSRSRSVATQVHTYAREDVTQATPPIKACRIIVQAATKTTSKGQHDCLIGRHDIRVAFFHAKGSGRVVIIPQRDQCSQVLVGDA